MSCTSIFSTVFKSSSISVEDMVGFLLVTVGEVAVVLLLSILLPIGLVVEHLSRARVFLAAFFLILSMFAKWRTEN